MDDLDIVAVRIEDPGRIVAGVVFEPPLRRRPAFAPGVHSRFVKCMYRRMVCGWDTPSMSRRYDIIDEADLAAAVAKFAAVNGTLTIRGFCGTAAVAKFSTTNS